MLMTVAPAGAVTLADGPIAVILPFVTTIVACSMGALPVPSITRAPVNANVPGAGVCAWPVKTTKDTKIAKHTKPKKVRDLRDRRELRGFFSVVITSCLLSAHHARILRRRRLSSPVLNEIAPTAADRSHRLPVQD
jgi:hypothetical protein